MRESDEIEAPLSGGGEREREREREGLTHLYSMKMYVHAAIHVVLYHSVS